MKLIVGLGNPGVNYKNNRHNVGFMILDILAKERGLSWKYSKDLMCYFCKTDEYVLAKPNTFMNNSGSSVAALTNFFKIESKSILVVYDELDLEFGKIRLSFNGSSAGHRGAESINTSLATQDFARLRVGIGRPTPGEDGKPAIAVDKYVISDFSAEQQKDLPEIIAKSEEAIKSFLDDGLIATMNRFN